MATRDNLETSFDGQDIEVDSEVDMEVYLCSNNDRGIVESNAASAKDLQQASNWDSECGIIDNELHQQSNAPESSPQSMKDRYGTSLAVRTSRPEHEVERLLFVEGPHTHSDYGQVRGAYITFSTNQDEVIGSQLQSRSSSNGYSEAALTDSLSSKDGQRKISVESNVRDIASGSLNDENIASTAADIDYQYGRNMRETFVSRNDLTLDDVAGEAVDFEHSASCRGNLQALRVDSTKAVILRAENEKAEKLTDQFFDHSLEGGRVIGIAARIVAVTVAVGLAVPMVSIAGKVMIGQANVGHSLTQSITLVKVVGLSNAR
jgi:hypothetical protein